MKHFALLFTCILLFPLLSSCSKDDDGGNNDSSSNKYSYMDRTVTINMVEYAEIEDDVYIFLMNQNNYYDFVQIIFANSGTLASLDGTYTLNTDRYNPNYNSGANFWQGNIGYEENVLGDSATAGQVIIENQWGSNIKITFQFTMPNGNASGIYEGVIIKRNF
ncbi:MAG: hypothetical protein H0X63_04220 [Flavobacteriales bacterium]|nr:hypothetical protein [Flavobacteriales bacterium]